MSNNLVLKSIIDRRSIRKFEDKELAQQELDQLRQAVLAAPTAMNLQELKFSFVLDTYVIENISQAVIAKLKAENNTEALERIASRHSSIFYGAPLLVIISAPENSKYSEINAGIAVQTLALAAQSMGLGSCIIGMARTAFSGSEADEYKELAGIPADNSFIISIAIGHPAISKDPHPIKPENISYIRNTSV